MGFGCYSDRSYATYASTAETKTRGELFHRTSAFAPVKSGQEVAVDKIAYRESRDSEAHPCSLPVIVGLDVSGSMGVLAEHILKKGLGTLVGELIQRRVVPDPHMLFLAIGDAVYGDRQPLQATQFEADTTICKQLEDLWLEGGGGGNDYESYDLAWVFAAYKTKTDAWEKRQAKGYVITVGDECFPSSSAVTWLRTVFGSDLPQSPTPESLLADCEQRYRTFHIVISEGNYCKQYGLDKVLSSWQKQLQKRVLVLRDYECLPELVVSALALDRAVPLDEVLSWWPAGVSQTIRSALPKESQA